MTYGLSIKFIKETMKNQEISFRELGGRIGFNERSLFNWFHGRSVMQATTFFNIVDALGYEVSFVKKGDSGDKEQLERAKEVIRKLMTSEYGSSCQFCIHDDDPDAVCCNVGGSGSWCCENAKWNGRDE